MPAGYWATSPDPRVLPLLSGNVIKSGVAYEARRPEPLRTLFLIDVSVSAADENVLNDVCSAIFDSVYGDALDNTPEITKLISLMTFDSALHFYDLSVSRALFSVGPRMNSLGVDVARPITTQDDGCLGRQRRFLSHKTRSF